MKRSIFHSIFTIFRPEVVVIGFSLILSLTTILIVTYSYFAKDLTSKERIMNKNDTGVILLDRYGKPFFTFYQAKHRRLVRLTSVPLYTQQAIITAEDNEFYSHPGFSFRGIFRALFIDVQKKYVAHGGSTITQQLVKNALLNAKKTFARKLQEIILALEIERRYSKKEILEMYLNSVYFGEGAFGIEEASLTYFGKHASDLTLSQSTLLASLLPSPSVLSPFSNPTTKVQARQRMLLQSMGKQGYISEKQVEEALEEKLVYHHETDGVNSLAPHFALMVRDELIRRYGEEKVSRSGMQVKTTLDPALQSYAERAVRYQVERLSVHNVSNGSAVGIEPKAGEILFLVGSKDWYDNSFGKVNVVTSLRQSGSAFKPIIYAAGFEERIITPATILQDELQTFPGNYKPHDYDNRTRGRVTVRRALANSLNIPSVEVMERVGLENGLEMAKRLGITTLQDPSSYGLSLVLGAADVRLLDLTGAYAVFANNGERIPPHTILEIRDKTGSIVYKMHPIPQPVLEPEVAFLISSILSDTNARSEIFGNILTISRIAAVKTGTTEDFRDALTVGYTPSIAIGVWVGNNDNTPMDQVAGSLGAAPIWKSLMEYSLKNTPQEPFRVPENIVRTSPCHNDFTTDYATGSAEYFIDGTQPFTACTKMRAVPIAWPQPPQLQVPRGISPIP